jgi:hypothetical protein
VSYPSKQGVLAHWMLFRREPSPSESQDFSETSTQQQYSPALRSPALSPYGPPQHAGPSYSSMPPLHHQLPPPLNGAHPHPHPHPHHDHAPLSYYPSAAAYHQQQQHQQHMPSPPMPGSINPHEYNEAMHRAYSMGMHHGMTWQ